MPSNNLLYHLGFLQDSSWDELDPSLGRGDEDYQMTHLLTT